MCSHSHGHDVTKAATHLAEKMFLRLISTQSKQFETYQWNDKLVCEVVGLVSVALKSAADKLAQ